MTVSYNQDIINSQTLTFLRIIFRWRGSLWKSVAYEVILWTIAYYSILVVYRFMLPPKWQIEFEHIAKYTDSKMDYLPLTFMLGFFVTFVVDRWKQIFANIGFVDGFAFFISTFIRGMDSESRMIRRNLVRYLCLTQVLVLRDISIRVRKRFPTMESLVDAGYLQTHEQILMEMNENGFPKYWMPIHWIFNICHDLHGRNRITGASYDNILQETKKFREQLQTLMNYDWVPVPLAYPQVICLATRIYFLLCLFGRQFRIHEQVDSHFYVEYYFPMMTVLQLICLMGWLKVAEALLNPMGDDDDDYECNYIIDRNKAVGMTMVDECHGQMPKQMPDTIGLEGEKAMYSEKSVNDAQNPLVGSATLVDHDDLPAEGEHVKMIERKPTIIPEILAERKKSRLSRVWSRAKRRRSSEPIQMRHQIHPSPTNLKSTTMADFGGLRFACSEGGNDLRDGLRGAKKISEIFPNKSDQNANFQMANSPENSPKLSQNDQSWPQHLERVSEEEDGSISTLNSLEMAELGLDPEEFSSKKGRRRKEGKAAK